MPGKAEPYRPPHDEVTLKVRTITPCCELRLPPKQKPSTHDWNSLVSQMTMTLPEPHKTILETLTNQTPIGQVLPMLPAMQPPSPVNLCSLPFSISYKMPKFLLAS